MGYTVHGAAESQAGLKQLDTHIRSVFSFFFHRGYHRKLSRVPSAIQQVFLVIYFKGSSVCIFISSSKFIPPSTVPWWFRW